MEKKQRILVVVIVALVVLLGFFQFKKMKNKEPDVNVFENAIDNITYEYITYGDYSNECLLFITNNNDFQVNVTGVIEKEDENGVKNKDWNDNININLNPKQTYVIETVNPNNKEARISRQPIAFDTEALVVAPVLGSDVSGIKSEQILFQDQIEYEISMEKLNDSDNPLIKITNKSERILNLEGYLIFYSNSEKKEIDSICKMSIYEVPANGVYKDYLSLRASQEQLDSQNYDVFINICE